MLILKILLFLMIFCVFFTYAGYAILLRFLLLFKEKKIHKKEYFPSVSLIISIHNEEKILEKKIHNSLALDYPADKLEILISSDGSSDRSIEIAETYAKKDKRIKVFDYKGHNGKIFAINSTADRASGEILAFTDANAMLDVSSLKHMTENFADDSVGCVCGDLTYEKEGSSETGEGLFKRYENILKVMESRLGSITAAEGSFFGLRKKLFQKIFPNATEDVMLVYYTVMQGKRAVYENHAATRETFPLNPRNETQRRTRLVTINLLMLWKTRAILNPFQYGFYSFELLAHKLFRWLSPFFLIIIFLLNACLAAQSAFYAALLIMQITFYVCGTLHLASIKLFRKKFLLFYVPFFFIISNIGMFLGFIFFFTEPFPVKWEVSR